MRALRADLAAAPYTVEAVQTLLGPVAAAALHREQSLPARRALAADERPLAVLVRLFVLGETLREALVADAVPGLGVDGLRRLDLVAAASGEDEVRAVCDLRPYADDSHGWWVVSDLGELATGHALDEDHVLGVGGASLTLASWTPRPLVERALDLGTGCGVQALHLSTHARAVVATDVSSRALRHAALGAALAGADLDLRHGSVLEPVAGERFDLVVANPPFVISPRRPGLPRLEYRDGGRVGDAFVAHLVRALPGHLRPGGLAQLLANWELREGEDWREHVSAWLDGTGLDALVVQRDTQDVAEYVETWLRDGGHHPGADPGHEAWHQAWLDDLAGRGIERIGFGVLTLQRPVAPRDPWRVLLDVPGQVAAPMGPAVQGLLAARTWLVEHTTDDLLDTTWVAAADVTEERIGRPGAPDPAVIQLRQGGGLRLVERLDSDTAAVVGAGDGDLTPRQALAGLAVLTDRDPTDLRDAVLPRLVDLVGHGFLTRSHADDTLGA